MSDENKNNQDAQAAESEAAPVTPEAKTSEPTGAEEKNSEHTVPVSALQKEREKAGAKIEQLEAKLAEVAKAEEERKRSELDEVERAKLEAQEATAKAEQLQAALVQEQRKQVALAAASTSGYRDPSDALRYIDLSGDLSEDDIREAVGKVLDERDYLKAAEPKGPAQTSAAGEGTAAEKAEDGVSAAASILSDAQRLIGR